MGMVTDWLVLEQRTTVTVSLILATADGTSGTEYGPSDYQRLLVAAFERNAEPTAAVRLFSVCSPRKLRHTALTSTTLVSSVTRTRLQAHLHAPTTHPRRDVHRLSAALQVVRPHCDAVRAARRGTYTLPRPLPVASGANHMHGVYLLTGGGRDEVPPRH